MSDEAKAGAKPTPKNDPPPPAAVVEVEKKSPREWAIALGHGPSGKPQLRDEGTRQMLSGLKGSEAYEIAKVLHGWQFHEDHEGKPIQLTRADFEAALKAALPEEGNPVPHKPALYTRRLVRFGES